MAEHILPTLSGFGIEPNSFIRKVDKQTHWNIDGSCCDLSLISKEVAARVFRENQGVYSLWQVGTEKDFYGIIAALTANANPCDRNIDFIWISRSDLESVGIHPVQVPEGRCLHTRDLHFNAKINHQEAEQLCLTLLQRNRQAKRCRKAQTSAVRSHQESLGCKAIVDRAQDCNCKQW